jgi:hypothetical protein
MEYMEDTLFEYNIPANKMPMVLFPHRVAPEKQVDIFKDLGKSIPEAQFVVAQEKQLTKDEYHMLLSRSKIVFSANQQETLGISCYEGALVGAAPLVPNRLSYTEMYDSAFKYPSEWTEDWDSYLVHKDKLVEHIRTMLGDLNNSEKIVKQAETLKQDFFGGQALYEIIRGKQL